jgi:sec-independent protein translocase protein TatA
MAGIQGWEWIWILLIALLLFGPKKLPDLGKAIGKSIREFKNATRGILSDEEQKEQTQAQVSASSTPIVKAEPASTRSQVTDHVTKP